MNKSLIITFLLIITNVFSLLFYLKLKNNYTIKNSQLDHYIENYNQIKITNDSLKKSLIIKKISNLKNNNKYNEYIQDSSEIISYINVLERQKLYIPDKVPIKGKYFYKSKLLGRTYSYRFFFRTKNKSHCFRFGSSRFSLSRSFFGKCGCY